MPRSLPDGDCSVSSELPGWDYLRRRRLLSCCYYTSECQNGEVKRTDDAVVLSNPKAISDSMDLVDVVVDIVGKRNVGSIEPFVTPLACDAFIEIRGLSCKN